jgi:hypothetical protein
MVDGRPAETLRGRGLATGIELLLPSGRRYTVTIVALTRAGRKLTATYRYRACADGAADRLQQPPTMLPARPGG